MSPVSSSSAKPNFRMIAASFGAGVGAMVLVGLVTPTIIRGGLSMANASASTLEAQGPAIEPIDPVAIQAQLDQAERDMAAARVRSEAAMSNLDRLAGR